jgi:hypothetical protein
MDPFLDPLVRRLIAQAMKTRISRSKFAKARIMDHIRRRVCLRPLCGKPIKQNGNCTACINQHRHTRLQIAANEGQEEAARFESRAIQRGELLAPGEMVLFRRRIQIEDAEKKADEVLRAI